MNEELITRFIRDMRELSLAFLRGLDKGLTQQDREDLFQEACLTLFSNIRSGAYEPQEGVKLSTYFFGILKNKAKELLRQRGRDAILLSSFEGLEPPVKDSKIDNLRLTSNSDMTLTDKQEAIVRGVVKQMDEPCHTLLWFHYWDGVPLTALAPQLGYTENSIKVIALRCRDKFAKFVQQRFNND